jgi:YHS domain-containing protein
LSPQFGRVLLVRAWENIMMTRRTILLGSAALAVLGSSSGPAAAQAPAERPLALKGYDPVAYFTQGKPTAGAAEYELAFDGQRYRFASAQHRDLFKANPDKYSPQFGGLCAMNLANGVRRESDPHSWVISNGNLYVFAGDRGAQNFKADAEAYASKAAGNWKTLKATATQ